MMCHASDGEPNKPNSFLFLASTAVLTDHSAKAEEKTGTIIKITLLPRQLLKAELYQEIPRRSRIK